MANIKSAKKRARQAPKKRERNRTVKGTVRTFEKKLNALLLAGDKEGSLAALTEYTSKISKAAQKGIVHVNNAARKVGRLSQKVAALTK